MSEEAHLKQQLRDAEYHIEDLNDFIEWLFDTEMDYTSWSEQWEIYQTAQTKEEENIPEISSKQRKK